MTQMDGNLRSIVRVKHYTIYLIEIQSETNSFYTLFSSNKGTITKRKKRQISHVEFEEGEAQTHTLIVSLSLCPGLPFWKK